MSVELILRYLSKTPAAFSALAAIKYRMPSRLSASVSSGFISMIFSKDAMALSRAATFDAKTVPDGAKSLDGGAKPEIQLQLNDNGPGLPHEAVRVLFDPFVIRSDTPAEYGIHLMACFFIVYHHGGKIEAKSEKGHGTTFTLRLPLHPDRATLDSNVGLLQKSLLNDAIWEKLIASE